MQSISQALQRLSMLFMILSKFILTKVRKSTYVGCQVVEEASPEPVMWDSSWDWSSWAGLESIWLCFAWEAAFLCFLSSIWFSFGLLENNAATFSFRFLSRLSCFVVFAGSNNGDDWGALIFIILWLLTTLTNPSSNNTSYESKTKDWRFDVFFIRLKPHIKIIAIWNCYQLSH